MDNALSKLFCDHMHKLNLTPYQKKIINKIINCQTPALGSHLLTCTNDDCSNKEEIYNSCKSIYCPKCQSYYQLLWSATRMEEVLPVEYMHLIFPVPSYLRVLFQYNPKRCLDALSVATKKALNSTFANNFNQIGALSIMHTNTQLLNYAPHIHCLMPKGSLNMNKTKWIQIKKDAKHFHERLSVQFKVHLIKELKKKHNELPLILPEDHIIPNVDSLLEYAKKYNFKIQIQDNVKDINHSLKYLGEKTKKVIIDNRKIIDYKDNVVTVSWSDRKNNNNVKEEEIDALLFLKRFVLHILPPRFTRIRYYGFLSNSCKKKSLKLCRDLITKLNIVTKKIVSKARERVLYLLKKITEPVVCNVCNKGFLVLDGL